MEIKKSRFITYLLLIPFFEPAYFLQFPVVDQLFFWGSLLGLIWVAMHLIRFGCLKEPGVVYPVIMLAGMNIMLLFSTYLNNGDISYNFRKLLLDITFIMLVHILIKRDLFNFIDVLLNVLLLWSIINMWSLFSYYEVGMFAGDDGMIQYFWAVDNHFISLLISMVFLAVYKDSVFNKNKLSLKSGIAIIVAIATLLKAWSATALIGMTIFIVGIILHKFEFQLPEFLKKRFLIFVAVAINVAVVIYNVQEYFVGLLDFLGKNSTLSLRTRIWEFAIDTIRNNVLLGLGSPGAFGLGGWFYNKFQGNLFMHNEFLELWVDGGIFAVIFFILFFTGPLLLRKKYKIENTSTLLTFFLIACYVMMITETLTPRNPIFAVLMVVYYEYTQKDYIMGEQHD